MQWIYQYRLYQQDPTLDSDEVWEDYYETHLKGIPMQFKGIGTKTMCGFILETLIA